MKEEETRAEFIDPQLVSVGWKVYEFMAVVKNLVLSMKEYNEYKR